MKKSSKTPSTKASGSSGSPKGDFGQSSRNLRKFSKNKDDSAAQESPNKTRYSSKPSSAMEGSLKSPSKPLAINSPNRYPKLAYREPPQSSYSPTYEEPTKRTLEYNLPSLSTEDETSSGSEGIPPFSQRGSPSGASSPDIPIATQIALHLDTSLVFTNPPNTPTPECQCDRDPFVLSGNEPHAPHNSPVCNTPTPGQRSFDLDPILSSLSSSSNTSFELEYKIPSNTPILSDQESLPSPEPRAKILSGSDGQRLSDQDTSRASGSIILHGSEGQRFDDQDLSPSRSNNLSEVDENELISALSVPPRSRVPRLNPNISL